MLMTNKMCEKSTSRANHGAFGFEAAQRGVSLIEVLVTVIILAFGLLALAGLVVKSHASEFDAYQRAQAAVLLTDMAERINANRANAASYVTTTPLGTGEAVWTTCTTLAVGATRDQCQWSKALQGSAESNANGNTGAMVGARGCIEVVQTANTTPGSCAAGIYRVSIVWQGQSLTTAPSLACGQNLYGNDKLRRALATLVEIGTPDCS
jgi:type IV pilus assembly protein PilV